VQRTILIMAGGTGGHIFPGLAVAEEMVSRGWRVVWMGARTGMEATLVPKHGYDMAWVAFAGVRGKGLRRLLLLPAELLVAFWQALREIRRIRPDVVLGMGGYISFPGGMMASLLGRPLVVHEQNAIAGATSRLLARIADRVLTTVPGAFGSRTKAEVTGNPVRRELARLAPPAARFAGRGSRLALTVVGGSLGAKALNETVPRALALIEPAERPQVLHQAGRQHVDALRAAYAEAGVEAEVVAFVEDMAGRLAQSDLVVCRAGATTLAELACVGVGSVLVPFPFAVDDHQTHNARFLAEAGAARLVPQSELTPEHLASILRGLDRPRLLAMAEAARSLGRPDAASRVADICAGLAPAAA